MNPRPSRMPFGLPLAVLLVAAACGGWVTLQLRNNARARALEARLAHDLAVLRGQRRARPVLRGAALDGNAAEAQLRATGSLAGLDRALADALSEALRRGSPLPAPLQELLRVRRAELASLRRAAQHPWTWTRIDLQRGVAAPMPEYRDSLQASKLLLAQATLAEPGECLRISVDVLRLAQDLVPGAGLLPQMIVGATYKIATPVLLRCAARATADERARASRELVVLARAHPPIGEALEVDLLATTATLRANFLRAPVVPASRDELWKALKHSSGLDAWEAFAALAGRWRPLGPSDFPAAFARIATDMARLHAMRNHWIELTTPDYLTYVHRDGEALARLRGLAVALAALAVEARTGELPTQLPDEGTDPGLRDPFTGRALVYRREGGGARVYALGKDGRDGGGASGTDDVTVELLPARPAAP